MVAPEPDSQRIVTPAERAPRSGDSPVHLTSSARESQGYASAVPQSDRASIRLLVIDDDRAIREGCASVLESEGYQVRLAGRGDDVVDIFRRGTFDIVLVDLFMTPVAGMEILGSIMSIRPETIVIMMTGNPSVHSSVEALRIGAWDYLPKPFSASHLQVLIGRAAYTVLETRRSDTARAAGIEKAGNSDRMVLLGNSPAFRRVVELARKVARTNASVMLVGESGTGKEMFAQFVHRHSGRATKPLVALNCAAVPEHLLESEMFGHRKGSFTGADRDKVGLIEVAHDGTFFLDELTEMPLTLQAKLLRVVQDGVLRRVGSEKTDATVDVRFISATNRDPRQAIKSKHLREDLFYRLNVFPIQLPPLRERVEDIPILANHFLQEGWRRHHSPREDAPVLGRDAMARLIACPWRGNVRELQNVIEQLSVLAQPGTEIKPDEISLHNQDDGMEQADPSAAIMNGTYHAAKDVILTTFEKEYLTRLMARAGGNMSRAARLANVDRTTLYRLLERHQFRRETAEPPTE
jgi:DNA-binding NtrC family response regulator